MRATPMVKAALELSVHAFDQLRKPVKFGDAFAKLNFYGLFGRGWYLPYRRFDRERKPGAQ